MKHSKEAFKTNLKQFGKRKKLYLKVSYLLIFILLITPCTNWLIPFVKKLKLGKLYYIIEK